jgi:hypothetical protein
MAFMSPGKLGEALRLNSPWFWALAIVAIVGVVMVMITPDEMFQQMVDAQRGGRAQPEGQPQMAVSTMRYIGAATGLVGAFIAAAVIAGVLYLIFNVIFGQSEINYKQHIAAVSHSWWILVVGNILTFVMQYAKGDATIRLGLGLLLADAPSSFIGHFMNGVTLFGLWTAVALGVVESGLSGGKTAPGKAATAVVVLYLVFAAISAALQGLGG